ncbi:Ribosomal RNA small subunit methyltransferase E [Stieleria maiorica]|uniref:Ribosomal RNA small subunit methyltransferase E n=1 Tax=Stieleria maiorica TaxID=2795974 RepID=A0A5B9MGL6_9BACT|nr:RsmE family RNA methyltransferase [Stieleria maiorica]QEG00014.1 Ribosomal RNA small subunit methyltransferase E [Stieleria maiorica]
MTRRYYAPDLPTAGGTVSLSDEEASHAARVMRAKAGDTITLFDGRGHESQASITAIDKRNCVVEAGSAVAVDREPSCRMHFGIALPKPERTKELIERLTELGVHRVTPLVCNRTQRPPTESLLAKLRRIVIESSKQCERNVLMSIDAPMPIDVFLAEPHEGACWIAHPDGRPIRTVAAECQDATAATVLVGPEGGFSDQEVRSAIESGFEQVGLGARIYRVETAACVLAAHLAG